MEESLRQAEEKYRGIFDNAVEGIFQSTPSGRYLSVNPALARMYGYASPEELMRSVTDIAHEVYVDPDCREALLTRPLNSAYCLPTLHREECRGEGKSR